MATSPRTLTLTDNYRSGFSIRPVTALIVRASASSSGLIIASLLANFTFRPFYSNELNSPRLQDLPKTSKFQ